MQARRTGDSRLAIPFIAGKMLRNIFSKREVQRKRKLFVNIFTANSKPGTPLHPLMFAEPVIRCVNLRFVCRPMLCNKTTYKNSCPSHCTLPHPF
jgi:hypothetical protein